MEQIADPGISDHDPAGTTVSFFDHPNVNWLKSVAIARVDAQGGAVTVKNSGRVDIDLTGWTLAAPEGPDRPRPFEFQAGFVLRKGASVQILSGPGAASRSDGNTTLLWTQDVALKSGAGPVRLYDRAGRMISEAPR